MTTTWTCATRRHQITTPDLVLRTTDRDDRDPLWRAVGSELAGAHGLTHERLDSLLLTGRLTGTDGGADWWLEALAITDRHTGRLLGCRTVWVFAATASGPATAGVGRWWLPRTDPASFADAELAATLRFAHEHLGVGLVREAGEPVVEHRGTASAACPATAPIVGGP